MNNIMCNILDIYFSKKLYEEIRFRLITSYNLDFKFIKGKDNLIIKCKKKKYNDNEYKTLITIEYIDSIYWLIRFEENMNFLQTIIKNYYEGEKE